MMKLKKDTILKFCTASNLFAALYVIAVFTILLIPSLGVKTRKNLCVDNRAAAPFPEISCTNYQTFAPQFERYIADRFRLRKQYIVVWNHILFRFFHESPHEQVVLGEDDLVFFASHFAGKEYENSLFKSILELDPERIRQTVGMLLAIQPAFQQVRPQVLFVTVPTKHSLDFGKIPETLRQSFRNNPAGIPIYTKITEELQKADPAYAEKYFLDLYPDAIAANRELPLFPPKSFHWIPGPYTHLAAHRIAEKFGVTQEKFVLDRKNYRWDDVDSDLKFFLGFGLDNPAWCLSEESNPVKRIPFTQKFPLKDCPKAVDAEIFYSENPAAPGGRILVMGDSFTPAICQDLARYFSQVTTMDMMAMQRYAPQHADHFFREIVKCCQPEYFVILSHGGYIMADVVIAAINDSSLPMRK